MTTKIQPKFNIGTYIRWNDPSKMERFYGEIYDIQYFENSEEFVYFVQTPYGPIPVMSSFQDQWEEVIFYIENSLEGCSRIQGYFKTLNDAKEGLKDGTGTIYMKGFGFNSKCQEVY